jgi:hypothetical protein
MSDPTLRRFTDLLGGLLGPSGPELTCEECFEHLDRYVELELADDNPAAAVPRMRAHLEGCPACAEDHDSLHALLESERYAPSPDRSP